MGKRLAAVGAAAAIGIGGLAVAAVNPLGTAGAQDPPATEAPAAGSAPAGRGPLARALDDLVLDGTLTQAQADAVTAEVKEEAKAGRTARKERRTATLAAVAEALGSTPTEVRSGIAGGTSIAAQAEAAGVDRQVVDDVLTKALTERIAAAVEAGTLTQAGADAATAKLGAAVDRILDADGSKAGTGRRGRLRERVAERLGD